MSSHPVIEFHELGLQFGDRTILKDFDLSISDRDKVVVRGKSGTGKSTLLRLALGFIQPNEGEAKFRGQHLSSPEVAWKLRREVAYVNQGVDLEPGTVANALGTLCRLRSCATLPEPSEMEAALEIFDFSGSILNQKTSELSGGEQQRVALAAALLMNRDIIIMDEPTASLDEGLTALVANHFLETFSGTVLVVSHDDAWFSPERATIVNAHAFQPLNA